MHSNVGLSRLGVLAVKSVFARFAGDWDPREWTEPEHGLDLVVEAHSGSHSGALVHPGRLFLAQVKTGDTWFARTHDDLIVNSFPKRLYHYWTGLDLPVLLVLCKPRGDDFDIFWELVSDASVDHTRNGFTVSVPSDQLLDANAQRAIWEIVAPRRELACVMESVFTPPNRLRLVLVQRDQVGLFVRGEADIQWQSRSDDPDDAWTRYALDAQLVGSLVRIEWRRPAYWRLTAVDEAQVLPASPAVDLVEGSCALTKEPTRLDLSESVPMDAIPDDDYSILSWRPRR
jgi:hypothetical protein